MIRRFTLLCTAAVLLQTLPLHAAHEPLVQSVASNGAYMATSPLRITASDWPWVASVGGLLGASFASDKTVRDTLVQHKDSKAAKDLRHYGDAAQFSGLVLGAIYTVDGWKNGNERSQFMSRLTWESLAWSTVFEFGGKFVIGRKRPNDRGTAMAFKPFGSNNSFPSGHTTLSFTAATLVAEEYDSLAVQIPAYTAASAVGYSRLYANKHWLSDVVAGAMLGYAVPHTLRKRLKASSTQVSDSSIIFTGDGFAWLKKF